MSRPASPLPSFGAAVLDSHAFRDAADPVAELRRLVAALRSPAAELWEQYRGRRGEGRASLRTGD